MSKENVLPNKHPDFYLTSSEGYDLELTRSCYVIKPLSTINRNDYLLVRIKPPIIGQRFGLGAKDIDVVILAPRHIGVSIYPIVTEWPAAVHVARIRQVDYLPSDLVSDDELELIGWAEIYPIDI